MMKALMMSALMILAASCAVDPVDSGGLLEEESSFTTPAKSYVIPPDIFTATCVEGSTRIDRTESCCCDGPWAARLMHRERCVNGAWVRYDTFCGGGPCPIDCSL